MWQQQILTLEQAAVVVVATTGMYLAFMVLVHLLGQRSLARVSSSDLAASVAFGSLIGRAALGDVPYLGGGIVALVTLFVLQMVAGRLRRFVKPGSRLLNQPLVVMAGDSILHDNLERSLVAEDELASALRLRGIRSLDEIACVILEPTGEWSVLRRDRLIDPFMLEGVRGVERVPASLVADTRGS